MKASYAEVEEKAAKKKKPYISNKSFNDIVAEFIIQKIYIL